MTRTFDLRRLAGLGLCLFLATACGDDEKKKAPGDSDGQQPGDGDAADGAGNTDDAGQEPTPAPDGSGDGQDPDEGDGDAGSEPADAGSDPVAPDGGEPTTPGTLLDLPYDGDKGSICYVGESCKGDDLLCYAPSGTAPGFCTEDCNDDTDCSPIDGIPATCSPDGLCRIDCSGDADQGDGECPEHMECRDLPNPVGFTPGQMIVTDILSSAWRCVYPVDGGKNDVSLYEKCDLDHGEGDCEGELLCHAPNSGLSASNPGYCSEKCETEADCTVPNGTTAAPVCSSGACEFDCGVVGANACPAGMNCVSMGGLGNTMRCRFIEG